MSDNLDARYIKMTETPVPKLLIELAIPSIIAMLISNIYNVADTAFVSSLGDSASGAVGIVFSLMSILQAVSFMFGHGGGSIMGRHLGVKNSEAASTTSSTAIISSFCFGIIAAVCGLSFLRPLVMFLGSTETIAPYAMSYLTYILLAAPFICASFTMNNLLRYEGKAALGTAGMMTGALLNIAGDPVLIFGFKMGIAGAGIATAVSQFIGFCVLLSMYLRGKSVTKLSLSRFTKKFSEFVDICITGMPSLMRQILTAIATLILNRSSSVYGDAAVAAMSIVSRVSFIILAAVIGTGQGLQPIASFNFGAGKSKRLKEAVRCTYIISQCFVILTSIPAFLLAEPIIHIFRDTPAVIEIGSRALRLLSVSNLFLPIAIVSEMLHQSTGRKAAAIFLSSCRSGLLFIPLLLILVPLRGILGIEEAQPVANVISIIPSSLLLIRFFRKLPDGKQPE